MAILRMVDRVFSSGPGSSFKTGQLLDHSVTWLIEELDFLGTNNREELRVQSGFSLFAFLVIDATVLKRSTSKFAGIGIAGYSFDSPLMQTFCHRCDYR